MPTAASGTRFVRKPPQAQGLNLLCRTASQAMPSRWNTMPLADHVDLAQLLLELPNQTVPSRLVKLDKVSHS